MTHRAAQPGFRSPTPSFDHATIGHPGEILVQPSTESRPERARQVDSRAAVVTERVDEGFSKEVGLLDRAMLRVRDIHKRVCEDFVPRLFAREGCEEDWRGENDRDDPPVSVMRSYLEEFCSLLHLPFDRFALHFQSEGKTSWECRYHRPPIRQQRLGLSV